VVHSPLETTLSKLLLLPHEFGLVAPRRQKLVTFAALMRLRVPLRGHQLVEAQNSDIGCATQSNFLR
jgi:hypothetical protein